MSNRPHRRAEMSTRSVEHMLATNVGKRIAYEVGQLKATCDLFGLDFGGITDLFQTFAALSESDTPTTIAAFHDLLKSRLRYLRRDPESGAYSFASEPVIGHVKSSGLVLPGDKDFSTS